MISLRSLPLVSTRWQSLRKSKIIVAIERSIYKMSERGREKGGKGLWFRQTANRSGANFEALFPEMSSSSSFSLCRAFPALLDPCLSYLYEFTARTFLQPYHVEIMLNNCVISLIYNICVYDSLDASAKRIFAVNITCHSVSFQFCYIRFSSSHGFLFRSQANRVFSHSTGIF